MVESFLSSKMFDKNKINNFDYLKISLASPENIRSWSYGEVKRPETINYRTFKPEREGLFCARIFGPIRDYECLCGKYKRIKYKGIVCEKCGVEVTTSKVRRDRMGHISLAAPVSHIWFLKLLPSRLSIFLDLPLKILEQVLYFEAYIVVEPGMTPLSYLKILTESQYEKCQNDYGHDSFKVMIGAEAIKYILKNLDLNKELEIIKEELETITSDLKKKKLLRKLKAIQSFLESSNKVEHMILDVLPVIPPDLRPLVPLDGGRFATSDLNELYRRVINRNNRLRRLIELGAPEIIIRNEKRMLQQAVDALLDNTKSAKPLKNAAKRPFKSLGDMLKGKQGRFRQNLLGKRVDYSGRSVIVVGPSLKLHQCGLPKKMALELFKPFVYSKLEQLGKSSSIKTSQWMVAKGLPIVWDILEDVTRYHPVLLNRAPTLHRLGIQAFEVVLIEGKSIQLHPLVCAAFNADFDGDQMAVHVPISFEAQAEAKILMMSINNILSPANGKPIIMPSQDIVLGLYFLTLLVEADKGEGKVFYNEIEVNRALSENIISLHSKIKVRLERHFDNKKEVNIVETTAGRVILYEILPIDEALSFDDINKVMDKKSITDIIDKVYKLCGQNAVIEFVDNIMRLGFKYATISGISIGKDDMVIPKSKKKHIEDTVNKVKEFNLQYSEGRITAGEKYNKVVDVWSSCTDKVASDMLTTISQKSTDKFDPNIMNGHNQINSIYIMSVSGARGSESQIKQLAGMRGLITKPNGEITETPVLSNFKEGLTVLEYFNSSHGARKGLADTALKTANSGYLTRRLVDIAQNCIISEDDCHTQNYIIAGYEYNEGVMLFSLEERILGRFSAEEIKSKKNGEVILKIGEFIDENKVTLLLNEGVDKLKIRSALTCESISGICAKCYGRDLSTGVIVNIGTSVGIIAAQSIGEPGTQLTMRTFHIGGVSSGANAGPSVIYSTVDGIISYKNVIFIENRFKDKIILNRSAYIEVKNDKGVIKASYKLVYGAKLLLSEGDKINKGAIICEWDPYNIEIIAECSGKVSYEDLVRNVSYKENYDVTTGLSSKVVIDWKGGQSKNNKSLVPALVLLDENNKIIETELSGAIRYFMSPDIILNVADGDNVEAGDILAKMPRKSSRIGDITGGLPRVAELFEARKPKDEAILCEYDGTIKYGKDYKSKRRIMLILDDDPLKPVEYSVLKIKHLLVNEGDKVKKGDLLVEGEPSPHDLLTILGVETWAKYMITEIQKVYRLQGVSINDIHIEVILSQMIKKVEIIDPGHSELLAGTKMNKQDVVALNKELEKKGESLIKFKYILQGITKASLDTDSFISAASFQETTKVLTEASLEGKIDNLKGLKENVIVGRLIPAGSGFRDSYLMKKEKNLLSD